MSGLVSDAKFPASWENTGSFRYYVASASDTGTAEAPAQSA
jgi:hypothetical protein